jgi:hypothetical protein
MTLLVLYALDGEGTYAGLRAEPPVAGALLAEVRAQHPDAFLAEPLTSNVAAKNAIPGELARAVDAWNAMPKSVTVPRLRGNLSRFVAPYRKWKKEAGQRDYLLEQLVADVAAMPFCWPWIRFAWLFGKKAGELNSEKLRTEAARGGWKGEQEITAREYLKLAERVARWRDMNAGGVDGSPSSFTAFVGVSPEKYEEFSRRIAQAAGK